MNKHLATLAVLLSLAAPLSAQEKTSIRDYSLHVEPYIFMAAGQAADVWITTRNFGQGCVEANQGVFGSARPSVGRLVAVKAAGVLPAVLTTMLFQKTGHQKAAKITAVISGSIGFGAAGYNLTVKCGR